MSRIEKVKIHNKNVLSAIKILELERYSDRLKSRFYFVNNIGDFINLKNSLVGFYNELSIEYNKYIENAKADIKLLNEEREKVNNAPAILKSINKRISELDDFVKTKDANYEQCVSLYNSKQNYTNDLDAQISYEEQVTEITRVQKQQMEPQFTYDVALHMCRWISVPRIVYVSKPVTKVVTKYRPDTEKIENAKIQLAEIEKQISKIPNYNHNIEVLNAYKIIEGLKEEIEKINNAVNNTEFVQNYIIEKIEKNLKKAKELKEILTKEQELMKKTIKNPEKFKINAVEEIPEKEM